MDCNERRMEIMQNENEKHSKIDSEARKLRRFSK